MYTMTKVVEIGPAQRNELEMHEPIWLIKDKLWAKEQNYFVSQVVHGSSEFEAAAPSKTSRKHSQEAFKKVFPTVLKQRWPREEAKQRTNGLWSGMGEAPFLDQRFGKKAPGEQASSKVSKLSFSGVEGGKNLFCEPVMVKIFDSGAANHIYHSYNWTQTSNEQRTTRTLRTSAGRVLVNDILAKVSSNQF